MLTLPYQLVLQFLKKIYVFHSDGDNVHTIKDKNVWFEMLGRKFSYVCSILELSISAIQLIREN